MKRIVWFLVILIVLAALLGPGVTGMGAEKIIEKELEHAVQRSAGVELLEQEFQRGWFSSGIKITLALRGEKYLNAARDFTGDYDVEQPVMVIDGSVRHGPFPSFVPALASSRTTITLQAGDDHVFEVPGEILARLGFTGGGTARYLAEEMQETLEDGSLDVQWHGADIRVAFNAGLSSFETSGELGALSIRSREGDFDVGAISLAAKQERSEHGLWLGSGELKLDKVAVEPPGDADGYSLSDLSLETGASLAEEKVAYLMNLEAGSIRGGALGEASAALKMTLNDLDATALARLIEASQGSAAEFDALIPSLMGEVQALLAGGPALDVSELRIVTPEGETLISLNLKLPAADGAQVPLDISLLGQLIAEASLRVPKAAVERLRSLDPSFSQNLQQLIAAGILRGEGTLYVMDAAYEGASLTVNGVPMPLGDFGSAPR